MVGINKMYIVKFDFGLYHYIKDWPLILGKMRNDLDGPLLDVDIDINENQFQSVQDDESRNECLGDLDQEEKLVLCGKNLNVTSSQLIAIVLLSIYYLLSSSYYSLFAPFLPGEALKKNISQTQVGIIFGVFELVLIILIPVFGKYVRTIND